MGFPFHPHSGIATLTYVRDADGTYEDTTGKSGVLRAGGLEWMMSGGGVWHRGGVLPNTTHLHGFQLWVAMPPSHEEAPAESHYIPPEEVPLVDGVRVGSATLGTTAIENIPLGQIERIEIVSGPASGRGANDSRFLPAVFQHYATGRNQWTGPA
jgi:redox-sensitive bicupin YhaK (pirin superfamily)